MCAVSAIMDHYVDKWGEQYPRPNPILPGSPNSWGITPELTQQEIQKLREFILNDLPEFKALLERMRQYDIDNDQPDCELEEKKQRVLDLAEELGIEIDFL